MISNHRQPISFIAVLSLTLAAPALQAATLFSAPTGGVAYNQGLSLTGTDTGTIAGGVGQWSWQDPAISTAEVPNGGWGHTSNWIAVTLTQASVLQISIARNSGVPALPSGFLGSDNYFPAFTIWQNWDTDVAPLTFYDPEMAGLAGNYHVYPNTANVGWAEDMAYLDHYRNNGTETSISDSWMLPAGNYTFAIGGLALSSTNTARQGYLATFTTSAVPEPGSLACLAIAGLASLSRRRR